MLLLRHAATPPPRNLRTGNIQKTSIRKRSTLFLHRQVTSHRFLFLMRETKMRTLRKPHGRAKQNRESHLVLPCFPQGEIFESVHKLTTQKLLSHYPLKATRILVTALVLGKDRLTTLPRATGTNSTCFLSECEMNLAKAFNQRNSSTDIAEHRLACLGFVSDA